MNNRDVLPAFQRLQYAFAAHIRNPDNCPAPANIEERRMNVYRELFYNNVEGFLSSGFPVLRSLLTDTQWHQMVRKFFAEHRCQTPYFLEISQEFLTYLQTHSLLELESLPFAIELAHYEWLELAVDVDSDTIPTTGFNPQGDLLHGHPVLSPLANVVCYDYPVHKISVDFIPCTVPPESTYLIVYRNRDDQVRFMEINAITAQLLALLQDNQHLTGREVLTRIQQQLPTLDSSVILQGGEQALRHLHEVGIILGTELKSL